MAKEIRIITEVEHAAAQKKLQGLRRIQLWKIADEAGLAYPAGATADHMRGMLAYAHCIGHKLNIPAAG